MFSSFFLFPPPPPTPPFIFASSEMRGNLQQVAGVSALEQGVPGQPGRLASPHRLPQGLGSSSLPLGGPGGRRLGHPGGEGLEPPGRGAVPRLPLAHVGPAPGGTSACGGGRREKPPGAVEGGSAPSAGRRARLPESAGGPGSAARATRDGGGPRSGAEALPAPTAAGLGGDGTDGRSGRVLWRPDGPGGPGRRAEGEER